MALFGCRIWKLLIALSVEAHARGRAIVLKIYVNREKYLVSSEIFEKIVRNLIYAKMSLTLYSYKTESSRGGGRETGQFPIAF